MLDPVRLSRALNAVLDYAKGRCDIRPGFSTPMGEVPFVLATGTSSFALWPIHPLRAVPTVTEQKIILEAGGDPELRLGIHNRPLWVVNHLDDMSQ